MDELPDIQIDLKSPRSSLFMGILYYTAGNWDVEDIYTAMCWIDEWENENKKPGHLKAVT